MITIFDQSLIYWSGILAGLSLIFAFLGCCCSAKWNLCKYRFIPGLAKHHKAFVYLAITLTLIHISFALLAKVGIIL